VVHDPERQKLAALYKRKNGKISCFELSNVLSGGPEVSSDLNSPS
jgi:hypothetical protein